MNHPLRRRYTPLLFIYTNDSPGGKRFIKKSIKKAENKWDCVVFGCNGSSNSGASPSPSLWDSQISSMSTRKWSFWVFFFFLWNQYSLPPVSSAWTHREEWWTKNITIFLADCCYWCCKEKKKNQEKIWSLAFGWLKAQIWFSKWKELVIPCLFMSFRNMSLSLCIPSCSPISSCFMCGWLVGKGRATFGLAVQSGSGGWKWCKFIKPCLPARSFPLKVNNINHSPPVGVHLRTSLILIRPLDSHCHP